LLSCQVAAVQIMAWWVAGRVSSSRSEAAEFGQPGEAAFHDPAAVEQDEALGLAGALDDRHGQVPELARVTDEPAWVPGVGHPRVLVENASPSAAVMRNAPSRSGKEAVVTTTASSSPPVSTATCRLRPLILFPPSAPLLVVGTVAAARTV
jgi:hypothetical protein